MLGLSFPSWGFTIGALSVTAAALLLWQGRYAEFTEHVVASTEKKNPE